MGFSYYCIIFLLTFVFDEITAQASAFDRCVERSVCPGGIPSDPGLGPGIVTHGGLDPRIVTPDDGGGGGGSTTRSHMLCQTAQVACYGQSAKSKCGMHLASGINTNKDGTAQPGAFPWLAYMSLGNKYIGAGVLLNNYNVLTVAHRVINYKCVVAGWGQTGFTKHNAPTNHTKQVDVPIVSMDACYASYSNASLLGNKVDKYLDKKGEICAGGQAMRDACTLDGGAPLVCLEGPRSVIAGLVSSGKNCGQATLGSNAIAAEPF